MTPPTLDKNLGRTTLLWILAAWALLLIHALSFRFMVDDAFISFRYAQNLIAGHGLVFNPGEPVEGYSNLLWVLLIAAGLKAGLSALLWARILGALCTLGTLILLPGIVQRLDPLREIRSPWPGRLAPVLTAACGAVACWTLAGLETPLFCLLMVWGWRSALARHPLQSGLAGLLMVLVRPEGPALALIFLGWSFLPDPDRNTAPGSLRILSNRSGVGLLILGAAAFFLWRHVTYGWWLPNTYYAKTGDLKGQLATGLPYGLAFARAYLIAPALVVLGTLLRGHRNRIMRLDMRLSFLLIAFWWCYVVVVGGDMLGMYRFFAPLLPVVITAVVVLAGTGGWCDRKTTALALGGVMALGLFVPSLTGRERRLIDIHMSEANLGGWILAGDAMAGERLARFFPPGTTLALGPAGYIPWKTGLVCHDFYGLVDPAIAHHQVAFTQHYAGHEKHDGALVLARRPDYILLGNVDITDAPRTGPTVALAREMDIFNNPDFKRDYVRAALRLGDHKFLNLFQRKDFANQLDVSH